jgi:hypothetical protein
MLGGLELLGTQRKEFIPRKREEGRKAERTGVSESLGWGELAQIKSPLPVPSPRMGGEREYSIARRLWGEHPIVTVQGRVILSLL